VSTDKPEATGADKPVLIYATFPSLETAEKVTNALVDARLVACANLLPGAVSIYRWQGRRHRDTEVVAILKTRHGLLSIAVAALKAQHPYEVPAIVALQPVGGAEDFFAWIATQTKGEHEPTTP
jgi:periplasmic divalent cation tolerance protein